MYLCCMKGYIYKFENKINRKVYIGQTIRNVKTRYNEHLQASIKELDQQKRYLQKKVSP